MILNHFLIYFICPVDAGDVIDVQQQTCLSFKYWQCQNYYSMEPISNAIFYSAAVYKTVELY
jgi:hypothetical protein